jgi:predicted O-methyltransferase YrrM
MSGQPDTWTEVEEYVTGLFGLSDPVLDAALADSAAAGLPPIQVSPAQGKLLMMLARMQRARTILEIGTLGGYSTIWLGRGLGSGGYLVTIESNPVHAAIARQNVARAALPAMLEVRVGAALDILPELVVEGHAPFDLIFIDADKPTYPEYLAWSLRLAPRGTVIVADNVVRRAASRETADPAVSGIRRFNEQLAADPRVTATIVQTVGAKGYDGFAVALVTTDL